MTENNLKKVIQHLSEEQQKRVAKEIIDSQINIIGALYDKAATYTNIIIIAGYASFFGLWSLTKEHLNKEQILWAAIFISISLISFVFFEVVKMIITSFSLLKQQASISDPAVVNDPNKLLSRLQRYDFDIKRINSKSIKVWLVTLVISIITGLIAIGIMFWAFICGLYGIYA